MSRFQKRRFCWLKKKTWVPIPRTSVRREPICCFAVNVSGVPFVGGSAGHVCHRASVLIVEEAPRMALQSGKKIYNLSQATTVKYQDKCLKIGWKYVSTLGRLHVFSGFLHHQSKQCMDKWTNHTTKLPEASLSTLIPPKLHKKLHYI